MKDMRTDMTADTIIDFHGTEAVRLSTSQGATAVVALQGAQVLSWTPASGGERLYLSEKARFEAGVPIRGGVPVLFPQFGSFGPGQRHGFARCLCWTLDSCRQQERYACAVFRLEADAQTRALWPHAFMAELTVMLEGERLDMELEIFNTDAGAFQFTAALHTYLRLGNVELARVEGLEGHDYLDWGNGAKRCHDSRYALLVDDAIDRIYLGVDKPLLISEPGRQLAIEQTGFRDTVVWNPWETNIAAFPDMAPLDFKRMLCVEAAAVEPLVVLAPNESWCGRQTLMAL